MKIQKKKSIPQNLVVAMTEICYSTAGVYPEMVKKFQR